ncbi:MAG: hypothetical protein JSS51_09125 [Planctomycetes bacterium]|nr:hypothetical protein [Planctomycetota bacterium]
MSADYVPGGKMSMLARRGMAPDAVRRTITRLWEQAPWVPVLDELWQWHNYKSTTAYGNASYIDGSVRRSDWGTEQQKKRWEEAADAAIPVRTDQSSMIDPTSVAPRSSDPLPPPDRR